MIEVIAAVFMLIMIAWFASILIGSGVRLLMGSTLIEKFFGSVSLILGIAAFAIAFNWVYG